MLLNGVFYACIAQVVDMVLMTSFRDMREDAVTADPLVKLPCGHILTTSTLDGWMDMAKMYEGGAPGAGKLTMQGGCYPGGGSSFHCNVFNVSVYRRARSMQVTLGKAE